MNNNSQSSTYQSSFKIPVFLLPVSALAIILLGAGCSSVSRDEFLELKRSNEMLMNQTNRNTTQIQGIKDSIDILRSNADNPTSGVTGRTDPTTLRVVKRDADGKDHNASAPDELRSDSQPGATSSRKSATNLDDYGAGRDAYRAKNYSEAIKSFGQFVSANPDNPNVSFALYYLGDSYYLSGNYPQAIFEFQHYLEYGEAEGDKLSDSLLKLGMAYAKIGDKKNAKVFFKKVIQLFPRTKYSKRAAAETKKL